MKRTRQDVLQRVKRQLGSWAARQLAAGMRNNLTEM